jgi:glutathione peroxidase
MPALHELSARTLSGQEQSLADYQGKVLLVVNTASHCGFTPQYTGLEAMYQKYRDQGLVILGFPCNQFGGQEPGGAEQIAQTCQINYGVTFPMFAKVEVNGPQTHPIFGWLKARLPGWFGPQVRWNFTKFLVGRDGKPIKRFAPITTPARIESAVREALGTR